jgi:hypothetical protein
MVDVCGESPGNIGVRHQHIKSMAAARINMEFSRNMRCNESTRILDIFLGKKVNITGGDISRGGGISDSLPGMPRHSKVYRCHPVYSQGNSASLSGCFVWSRKGYQVVFL